MISVVIAATDNFLFNMRGTGMTATKEKKNVYKKYVRRLYTISSVIIAYISAVTLWYYNVGVLWSPGFTGRRTLFIVGVLYCAVYWFFAKMYNAHKIGLYRLVELTFSQLLTYAISDIFLFGASFVWFHNFKRIHVSYYLIAFVAQMFVVVVLIFICNRLFAKVDTPRNVSIIYGNDSYKFLIEKMEAYKYRYKIVKCVSEDENWKSICTAIDKCEDVYLYEINSKLSNKIVMYCDKIHREVHMTPSIEDIVTRGFDVSHAFDTPFIKNKKSTAAWYYPGVKRIFDVVCSLISLVVLSPILIITALAIKLYDHGPVFYKQVRMTKGGNEFKIYKFRSMIPDAEKGTARLAAANDDRITPVGKVIRATRIDELPQFINILKGDMSFVGPRPERPEIARQYEEKIPEFSLRLAVKAGLTGYAQVYGKYNTTPLDKLKLDLLYITNQSITLDLKILFYTVKIIFVPESTEGVDENQETAYKE